PVGQFFAAREGRARARRPPPPADCRRIHRLPVSHRTDRLPGGPLSCACWKRVARGPHRSRRKNRSEKKGDGLMFQITRKSLASAMAAAVLSVSMLAPASFAAEL